MIHKIVPMLFLSLSLGLLTGCAPYQYKYQDSHSEAYNITRASDMHSGIRDYSRPKNAASSSGLYDGAYIATSTLNSGMNMASGFGFGVLSTLTDAKDHGSRETLIGWLPLDYAATAKEAQVKLMGELRDAIIRGVTAMGGKPTLLSFQPDRNILIVQIEQQELGCMGMDEINAKFESTTDKKLHRSFVGSMCQVKVILFEPKKGTTPNFLVGKNDLGTSSWVFKGNDRVAYSRLIIETGTKGFDSTETTGLKAKQLEYISAVTATMPSTLYLFMPARKSFMPAQDDSTAAIPLDFQYVINGDGLRMFVYPEK